MALSTHALDLSLGAPAAQVEVTLSRIDARGNATEIARAFTDADGRIAAPFGGELSAGEYELRFAVAAYYAHKDVRSFFADVPVRFRIDDAQARYHVPLLLSPWGYSTYRGS